MDDAFLIPIIVVPILFIGLPWLILHYVTKWKVSSGLTAEDETMLDDLYELARRLDERMHNLERIVGEDQPTLTALAAERPAPRLDHDGDEALRPRRRSNMAEREPQGRA